MSIAQDDRDAPAALPAGARSVAGQEVPAPIVQMDAARPHRSDIDGLRAVAVLLVLLFHTGLGAPGGFVGVDVFFVISGYLITGVILRDLEVGTFTIGGFWVRRIRRIAPAATCLTAAALLAGEAYLLPKPLVGLAESAMAHQLMASNVYFSMKSGYFDGPAELKPLLHTWSLSVEEQFYLLFPLVFLFWGRLSRRAVIGALSAACATSFLFSVLITDRYPSANFYWLPARAWELLLGSLLAFSPAPSRLSKRVCEVLGIVGLGLILTTGALYSSTLAFPGMTALLPTLGAAALLYAGSIRPTAVGKMLAMRPLAIVGASSYSVYLWHWPLLVFLRHNLGRTLSLEVRSGVVLASLVVGWVSWRIVEEPIRRKRVFRTSRSLVALYVFAFASMLGVSLYFHQTGGLPARFSTRGGLLADFERVVPTSRIVSLELPDDVSVFGAERDDRASGLVLAPKFLLWGDSHAGSVSQLCQRLAEERGLQGLYASRGGFAPLLGVSCTIRGIGSEKDQLDWNQQVVDLALKRRIKYILIAARWECKLKGKRVDGAYEDLILDAHTAESTPDDARRVFRSGLARTLSVFEAAGAKVWFLSQVPVQDGDLVEQIAKGRFGTGAGRLPRGVSRSEYQRQQRDVVNILKLVSRSNFTVIQPPESWFDPQSYSSLTDGSRLLYVDDDHLSVRGAEVYFRPLLEPVFDEIAGREPTRHSAEPSNSQPSAK